MEFSIYHAMPICGLQLGDKVIVDEQGNDMTSVCTYDQQQQCGDKGSLWHTKLIPVFNKVDASPCQTQDTVAGLETTAGQEQKHLAEVDPEELAIRNEEEGGGKQ